MWSFKTRDTGDEREKGIETLTERGETRGRRRRRRERGESIELGGVLWMM